MFRTNGRSRAPLAIFTVGLAALALAGCEAGDSRILTSAPDHPSQSTSDVFKTELRAEIESNSEVTQDVRGGFTPIAGPTVITESGRYRVTHDFTVPENIGDGIVVQADFVFLSLGGHTITGPGNKIGRGIVLDGVEHVLVHNGTVRTFGVGVALLESDRSVVRRVQIVGGDEPAAPPANPPQIGALLVNSNRCKVVNNMMDGINLGIFVRGAGSYENRIIRNSVSAGDNGLLGVCYNPAAGEGDVGPTNDRVFLNTLNRFGTGIQASSGSAMNQFNSNTIYYFVLPWEDLNGTNEFLNNTTMQIAP